MFYNTRQDRQFVYSCLTLVTTMRYIHNKKTVKLKVTRPVFESYERPNLYIYICIFTYIHVYFYIRTYTYTHLCMYMHTHTHTRTHSSKNIIRIQLEKLWHGKMTKNLKLDGFQNNLLQVFHLYSNNQVNNNFTQPENTGDWKIHKVNRPE